jgi:5-methylcytosine-specific restriction enzyme subunit McrC
MIPTKRSVVELAEWEQRVCPGVSLTDADRAALLTIARPRVEIYETPEGLAISAKSWVGVLSLPNLEVKIRPKLAGDHLHLARMIDYVHGLDTLVRDAGAAGLTVAGDSLLDLLALLFVEAAETVVRKGLKSGYLTREDDIPVVRGRILVEHVVLRRFGLIDKVPCRYDEYEPNVVENQLILAAIESLRRWVQSVDIRRRLDRLRHVFESVCDLSSFDRASARSSMTYDRLNAYYEPSHQLSWLLLDGIGVADPIAGKQSSFAFFLDMNALFERFVERWLAHILPAHEFRVRRQVQHSSIIWDAMADAPYSKVIPDVLVHGVESDLIVPVDAKYKRYRSGADEADIYQAFLYAWALGASPGRVTQRAILIHPSEQSAVELTRLRIRASTHDSEAQVVVFGVPVALAIDEARTDRTGSISSLLISEVRNGHEPRASSARVVHKSA